MSTYHTYALYRDANRHHCISVGIERKYTYYIPMEAAEVKVHQMEHREFGLEFELITNYPVRRAAEIFLAAPDKEVSPKAKEHLEAILADPAYVYDTAQFSVPHVLKEKIMASKNAAAVAAEIAAKPAPKNKKEALAAAAEIAAKPVGAVKSNPKGPKAQAAAEPAAKKTAPAKKAAKEEAAPRGRAPAVAPDARLKIGNADSVSRGYMLEFVNAAKALEKQSRGKGFTSEQMVEAGLALPGAEGRDEAWVKTYISYSLAAHRGIFVVA